MPYFDAAPNAPTILVSAGSKTYLLGKIAPEGGTMYVTSVAIATNVATVGVSSFSGALPIIGTQVTIRGTSQSSGAFNVTNAVVTAVTLDATGTGTITFALTSANLSTTTDGGVLTFEPQVTGETVVNNSFTIPGALARPTGARSTNAVFAQVSLPATGVTALTATMQVSEDGNNWISTTAVLTVTGSAPTTVAYFETTALFVRAALTGLAGSGVAVIVVGI